MASAHIRTRRTAKRLCFDVRYRLEGGREARLMHAGSFYSLAKAEEARDQINEWLAQCVDPAPRLEELASRRATSEVYFAEFGGLLKIGVSTRPEARCRELHATLLFSMKGGRDKERELHQRFAADRVRGEWFTFSDAIRDFVEEIAHSRRKRDGTLRRFAA